MCLPEMSLLMHDLRPHCPRRFICLQRLIMLQKEYKCKVVAVKNRTSQQNNSLGKPVYYVVKDCCLLSLFSSGSLVLHSIDGTGYCFHFILLKQQPLVFLSLELLGYSKWGAPFRSQVSLQRHFSHGVGLHAYTLL